MDKFSVLIVDDNETDRYLLKRQLKSTGHDLRVFEEEDGKEALEFFQQYQENKEKYLEEFPPLVVFLDINMPNVNGFEFLEKFGPLREKFEIKSSFVMMFSSSERKEDREKAFSYSFVKDYLTKGSFSNEELKEKISKMISLCNNA